MRSKPKETMSKRLKRILGITKLALVSLVYTPQSVPIDSGCAEKTIDENGNVLRFVRREAGSDITTISERQPDGSMYTYSEWPVKQHDGSWAYIRDDSRIHKAKF